MKSSVCIYLLLIFLASCQPNPAAQTWLSIKNTSTEPLYVKIYQKAEVDSFPLALNEKRTFLRIDGINDTPHLLMTAEVQSIDILTSDKRTLKTRVSPTQGSSLVYQRDDAWESNSILVLSGPPVFFLEKEQKVKEHTFNAK